MAKLDEELVAAFIVEKFKVTQSEAWDFIDSVKRRAKEEAAEKESSGERKKKEYAVVVYDPEKKLNLDNYSAFIVEKVPTSILENGSSLDSTSDRDWGDLELPNLLDVSIKEAKRKYSKKGPFNSLADIVQYAPAKMLKNAGLKFISKNPSSIITFASDNLKNEEDDMLQISNNTMFVQ